MNKPLLLFLTSMPASLADFLEPYTISERFPNRPEISDTGTFPIKSTFSPIGEGFSKNAFFFPEKDLTLIDLVMMSRGLIEKGLTLGESVGEINGETNGETVGETLGETVGETNGETLGEGFAEIDFALTPFENGLDAL